MKIFFIKLISIVIAIIIIFNVIYNTMLADRMEKIDNFLIYLDKNNKNKFRDKIRNEIRKAIEKEDLFNEEDKILIKKFYLKLSEEFKK